MFQKLIFFDFFWIFFNKMLKEQENSLFFCDFKAIEFINRVSKSGESCRIFCKLLGGFSTLFRLILLHYYFKIEKEPPLAVHKGDSFLIN